MEVKVRLLEQLSCGFNSPQLAIEFIQMLLDEYNTLSDALPSLLYLLEPLVRERGAITTCTNQSMDLFHMTAIKM